MQFGLYLVKHGMITASQFAQALEAQLASRPQIGALAIETGKLSVKQVFGILRTQADKPHQMFGELAVQAGFLTEEDLMTLLYHQSARGKPMSVVLAELGFAEPEDLEDHFPEYRISYGVGEKMEPAVAS